MKLILVLLLGLTGCQPSNQAILLERQACLVRLAEVTPKFEPTEYRCISNKVYKLEKEANLWLETAQGCLSVEEVKAVKEKVSSLEKEYYFTYGTELPKVRVTQAYREEAGV